MLFSMFVGMAGIVLIVWQTTPNEATLTIRVSFFLAIFLFISGLVSILSFWIRYRFTKANLDQALTQSAYKHGFAVSTVSLLLIIIIRL